MEVAASEFLCGDSHLVVKTIERSVWRELYMKLILIKSITCIPKWGQDNKYLGGRKAKVSPSQADFRHYHHWFKVLLTLDPSVCTSDFQIFKLRFLTTPRGLFKNLHHVPLLPSLGKYWFFLLDEIYSWDEGELVQCILSSFVTFEHN